MGRIEEIKEWCKGYNRGVSAEDANFLIATLTELQAENERLRDLLRRQAGFTVDLLKWGEEYFDWDGVIPGESFEKYETLGEDIAAALKERE